MGERGGERRGKGTQREGGHRERREAGREN
jgi:hypothetical protein